jgi:hypothetical protein
MERAMADNSDSGESTAMFLRRARNVETVSSDIALRLGEMLFIRHYGQEVHGREGVPHRLTTIIKKIDGRILELVSR